MAESSAQLKDLSDAEFDTWMKGVLTGASTNQALSNQDGMRFDRETQAALDAASQVFPAPELPRDYVSPEGQKLGVRPGSFLNVNQGAPASTRFKMGLDRSRLNQFKFLVERYGADAVDVNDAGQFIIRNQPDETGGTQDIFVNPPGVEPGDIAESLSEAAPMVAGMLGGFGAGKLVKGAGRGVARAIAGALGMAGSQQLTGFVQDELVRLARGNELEPGTVAYERAKMAVVDTALGLAFAGGGKLATTVLEGGLGLARIPTVSTATTRAAKELKKAPVPTGKFDAAGKEITAPTNIDYPLTPGQASESKLLLRVESMAGGQPGTAGVMDRILLKQQQAEEELRRVLHGLPRTMTDDELNAILPRADLTGERALQILRAEGKRLEGESAQAAREMQRQGTAEVEGLAGVQLSDAPDVYKLGSSLRSTVKTEFENFRQPMAQRYETFLSKPEVTTRILDGDSLADAARKVELKFVPAKESGGQVTTLDRFSPAKLRGFIDDLEKLRGSFISVKDLKQIRTGIDNAIAEGIAIPGTDTAALKALRGSVDDVIEESLDVIDPALRKEWDSLGADYAKGMARFDRNNVRDLLIKEGEKGAVGNTKITERVLGSSPEANDAYRDYKAFFGPDSAEFKSLQDAARHDALAGSISDISGLVEGGKLRARLANIRPEIARELFGANKEEMAKIGLLLERAEGKAINAIDLERIAAEGSLTAQKLDGLIQAEEAVTRAYNNKLIKAAKTGVLDGEAINASEFVKRASRMDPKDLSRVMNDLSSQPDLVQDIRQLGIEEIWGRVQAGKPGQKVLSSDALDQALGDSTRREAWTALIGSDTVKALQQLVNLVSKRDFAAETFKGAGRMSGGALMQAVFLKGEIGMLPELAGRTLVGALYSGPFKQAVTNLMATSEFPRLLNAVISSTPFVEHLIMNYGTDGANALMDWYRGFLEPVMERELFVKGKVKKGMSPADLSPEEFEEWMKSAVQ